MKVKIGKVTAVLATLTMVVSIGTITALATEVDASSYGYLTGHQQNSSRHAQFENVASLATDEEREAFFATQDIGGDSPHNTVQHLDVEELVAAGIIDQTTADKIKSVASEKHDNLHARYESKSDMTPEERHTFFEDFKSDGSDGDSISELLNAGVITHEQADAINEYLSK